MPIRVSHGGDEPATMVMDGRQASLTLEVPAKPGDGRWFKINPQQTGFFRVNYQPEDWDRLIPAIKSQELSAADRLGIQNDAYSLSKSGHLPSNPVPVPGPGLRRRDRRVGMGRPLQQPARPGSAPHRRPRLPTLPGIRSLGVRSPQPNGSAGKPRAARGTWTPCCAA